ncbi:MAG TPA: exosortase-associated EpsI family protein [Fimbriimonadaceae bacterium]|nr:exosortase-associated EpsI family protein [Fimbriimonadaceae bacterium]
MEGLKKRAIIATAVLMLGGLAIAFTTKHPNAGKTEQWMLDHSPRQVDGFRMLGGAESPLYSYKMDQVTYDTLQPYGIVARVYENQQTEETYDVVLIASQSKDSFHDPRVCFSAQQWSIENQWVDNVQTKTRGKVSISIVQMDGPDGNNRLAAFLYKGPGGFFGDTKALKLSMFLEQLKGGTNLDGAFYRFIPQNTGRDQTKTIIDMKKFIGEYLDAANQVSDGYF